MGCAPGAGQGGYHVRGAKAGRGGANAGRYGGRREADRKVDGAGVPTHLQPTSWAVREQVLCHWLWLQHGRMLWHSEQWIVHQVQHLCQRPHHQCMGP